MMLGSRGAYKYEFRIFGAVYSISEFCAIRLYIKPVDYSAKDDICAGHRSKNYKNGNNYSEKLPHQNWK